MGRFLPLLLLLLLLVDGKFALVKAAAHVYALRCLLWFGGRGRNLPQYGSLDLRSYPPTPLEKLSTSSHRSPLRFPVLTISHDD